MKKRTIKRCQSLRRPHLDSEKVGRHDLFPVAAEKLLPRGSSASLRRGLDPVMFQNLGNRFVCQHMTQIGQCSLDTAITPASVLLGHANDQRRNLGRGSRSSGRTERAAIVLLRNQFPVPGQQVSGVTIVAI